MCLSLLPEVTCAMFCPGFSFLPLQMLSNHLVEHRALYSPDAEMSPMPDVTFFLVFKILQFFFFDDVITMKLTDSIAGMCK